MRLTNQILIQLRCEGMDISDPGTLIMAANLNDHLWLERNLRFVVSYHAIKEAMARHYLPLRPCDTRYIEDQDFIKAIDNMVEHYHHLLNSADNDDKELVERVSRTFPTLLEMQCEWHDISSY